MIYTPLAPADIDDIELYKIDDAFSWLVGFVNRQLSEGNFVLVEGGEYSVRFGYDEFVHFYRYLHYWRILYRDIASLFREQGWNVTEYEKARVMLMHKDEAQPELGFRTEGKDA